MTTCLDEVRQLYTKYTGIEISNAVGQVRAELTAQREHEQSTESVTTYKYNQTIQDQIGPITWPKPEPKKVRKTRCKKTTPDEESDDND